MDDNPVGGLQEAQHVPLIRYGQNNYSIPGDIYGVKTAHSGNVGHISDIDRYHKFPKFDPSTFTLCDENWAESLATFLTSLPTSFKNGMLDHYKDHKVLLDTDTEKAVDLTHGGLTARVILMKDVLVSDSKSYRQSERAKKTALQTDAEMARIEPDMGRAVENFMMAEVINNGNAPKMPQYYATKKRPQGGDNRKKWYKQMRLETNKAFWLNNDREGRDRLRDAAKSPSPSTQATIGMIVREDRSHSQDSFYQHHKDHAAAAADNPPIYERINKDIFLVLDREANVVLCSVSQLFQRLFGTALYEMAYDAARQWAGFALLPQPNTQRHMVDELMRRHHPELDMELARTPRELEERAMCIVHYGTWAQQGHTDPDFVHLTEDTRLRMGWTERRSRVDYSEEVFPHFKVGVLGLSSEVARFLMRNLALREYVECVDTFRGLPKAKRMAVSRPNWATLFVFGVNSFTERHCDHNDIKHGFASLIPMGNYIGGDLFFPQLAVRLHYQPGDCVIFRGRELEHFVGDWTGYRMFVAATNHQPVRNWVNRRMKRGGAPVPASPAADGAVGHDSDSEDDDEGSGRYVVCVEPALDPEEPPEGGWTGQELHGPGDWSSGRGGTSSSSSDAPGGSTRAEDEASSEQPSTMAFSQDGDGRM